MSDYTKSTSFTSKDSLPSGDALKIVRGSELDTEFNAIATAVATKSDLNSPAFTGTPTAPTAAAGTNSTQLATTAFAASAISVAMPSATVLPYAGSSAPSGFLLCDGTAVSRSTYSALYTAIGTTYGSGDGSTTFNVPNLTNRFPVGAGGLYSRGGTGGSKDAVVVSHTHSATSSVSDPQHAHSAAFQTSTGGSGYPGFDGSGDVYGTGNTGSSSTGISVSTSITATGVSGTDANLPPYLALFWIIKT